MNICVYGASSNAISDEYFTAGERLGKALAKGGHTLVFGAGAGGMMGACARGAFSEGGQIIGISPEFFNVDGILFENCTELILTDTMRSRKQKMEELADAFVMLPGGLGTFDEFFEILTLKQLGRHNKPMGVLNIKGYFDALTLMLEKAVSEKFMLDECLSLFTVSENAEKLISALERETASHKAAALHKKLY